MLKGTEQELAVKRKKAKFREVVAKTPDMTEDEFTSITFLSSKQEAEAISKLPPEKYAAFVKLRLAFSKANYEYVLELFDEEMPKDEFLRIYNLPNEERWQEQRKFDDKEEAAFRHLCIAYRGYLRAKGEIK